VDKCVTHVCIAFESQKNDVMAINKIDCMVMDINQVMEY